MLVKNVFKKTTFTFVLIVHIFLKRNSNTLNEIHSISVDKKKEVKGNIHYRIQKYKKEIRTCRFWYKMLLKKIFWKTWYFFFIFKVEEEKFAGKFPVINHFNSITSRSIRGSFYFRGNMHSLKVKSPPPSHCSIYFFYNVKLTVFNFI